MLISLFGLLLVLPAGAEWKPEYASRPPAWQAWFQSRTLNEPTRVRLQLSFKRCCDHADVVKTRFTVNKTDHGDEWFYEDMPGHWKRINPDTVHLGQPTPDGQPVLFVYLGHETCFFPGDSGI